MQKMTQILSENLIFTHFLYTKTGTKNNPNFTNFYQKSLHFTHFEHIPFFEHIPQNMQNPLDSETETFLLCPMNVLL